MTTPPADTLRAAAAFVRDAVADGAPVLLHPNVGRALEAWLAEAAKGCDAAVIAARRTWGTDIHPDAQRWLTTGYGSVSENAIAVAHAILGTEPEHAQTHAVRPQERPGTVRAVPGMPETTRAPHTGAHGLDCPACDTGIPHDQCCPTHETHNAHCVHVPDPGTIADLLDEFIADAQQRGADPAWLRGARCITGRLRLADPTALGGDDDPGDGLRDRITHAAHAAHDPLSPIQLDTLMPVIEHWAQQLAAGRATWRARAEEIERDRDRLAARVETLEHVARVNGKAHRIAYAASVEHLARAEQAENAIKRLRAELDALDGDVCGITPLALAGRRDAAARIRAALADAAPDAAENAEAMSALERGEDHL